MGLYHSGVSIYGTEYCYGGHPDDDTGVFEVVPRKAPDAKFRQTILVGNTSLDPRQVSEIVNAMAQVWTGSSYNLLTRYVFNSSIPNPRRVPHRLSSYSDPDVFVYLFAETVITSPRIFASASRAPLPRNGSIDSHGSARRLNFCSPRVSIPPPPPPSQPGRPQLRQLPKSDILTYPQLIWQICALPTLPTAGETPIIPTSHPSFPVQLRFSRASY